MAAMQGSRSFLKFIQSNSKIMPRHSKVIRKLLVGFELQIITATSLVTLSVGFGLPALAQSAEADESAAAEVVTPAAEAAAPEPAPLEAVTARNPEIPVNQLETLLKPLNQEQLQVEADAWTELLQDKAQEISDLEIEIQQQQNEEISGDVDTEREKSVVAVTELEAEQASLLTRLDSVLVSLEAKGGDSTAYRQYMSAVSGVDFDFTDAESIGLRFTTWLQSEEGGIRWGINLLKVLGIAIAAVVIAPRVGKVTNAALMRVDSISDLFRGFIVMVSKRAVYVIAALLALASIGVSLGPLLALVGGLSFVLAFALQSNLSNFASGLMLLLYRPFDVDDEVEIAGHWAVIKEITLANTILQVWGEGRIISIPNSTVWGGTIVNYTPTDDVRKVVEKIHVNINEDLVEVKRIIDETLSNHPLVLKDGFWAGSYVWQVKDVADVFYVARCKADDYWTLYEDLVLQIHSRLREVGIAFAVPEYRVFLNPEVEHEGYGGHQNLLEAGDAKRTQEVMGLDFEAPN